MTRAAFVHPADIDNCHYPPDCPFRSERAGETRRLLASTGLLSGAGRREVSPPPAGRGVLETFHTRPYLAVLERASGGELEVEGLHMGLGTPETPVFLGLYECAALACGATLAGAQLILDGEVEVAFNPSGGFHHAHASQASGFCYLNDVVLGCARLAAAGRRVLFLDIDVHHCDGVQDAFYDRSDVFVMSFHETGRLLFPGTGFEDDVGVGAGAGYTANVPLPAGLYDEAFLEAFRAVGVPLIRAYAPDVIVLELGMDGLSGDPLAHQNLTNNAYADLIGEVLGFARPVLATGGGGYHVGNTVRGWALAWRILCGQQQGADEMGLGLGGVLMETTDWPAGLRDRALVPDDRQRAEVDAAVAATIEKVKASVFAYHGL